jgi:hypothetical protein
MGIPRHSCYGGFYCPAEAVAVSCLPGIAEEVIDS